MCKPFKNGISVPYSPLGRLDISLAFKSYTFGGLVSVQVARVGVPAVGHKLLISQGEAAAL